MFLKCEGVWEALKRAREGQCGLISVLIRSLWLQEGAQAQDIRAQGQLGGKESSSRSRNERGWGRGQGGKLGVGTKGWILDRIWKAEPTDFLAHDLSGVSKRSQERPQSIWSRETVRQELPLSEMEKYDTQYSQIRELCL